MMKIILKSLLLWGFLFVIVYLVYMKGVVGL